MACMLSIPWLPGDDGKASPVGPGTDDIESNGGPVSTDTKEPAPVKVATAKDMGVTGPGYKRLETCSEAKGC